MTIEYWTVDDYTWLVTCDYALECNDTADGADVDPDKAQESAKLDCKKRDTGEGYPHYLRLRSQDADLVETLLNYGGEHVFLPIEDDTTHMVATDGDLMSVDYVYLEAPETGIVGSEVVSAWLKEPSKFSIHIGYALVDHFSWVPCSWLSYADKHHPAPPNKLEFCFGAELSPLSAYAYAHRLGVLDVKAYLEAVRGEFHAMNKALE